MNLVIHSKSTLRAIARLALLPCVLSLFAACGSADDAMEDDLGEIGLAQDNAPTQGGSCTIVRCSGIKDPFGKYSCDKNGNCSCVRDGVSGACDSAGTCTEKCSGTTTGIKPALDGLNGQYGPDEVSAGGDDPNFVDWGGLDVSEVKP
jgi:hypothetical protein